MKVSEEISSIKFILAFNRYVIENKFFIKMNEIIDLYDEYGGVIVIFR